MAKRISVDLVKKTRVGYQTDVSSCAKKIVSSKAMPSRLNRFQKFSVELILVDDKEIQILNKRYRKKNKPTDVLSFAYWQDADPKLDPVCFLGQIIISSDTLRRQAKAQGHAYRTELGILFVHGLLHILGFDHETEKELKTMLEMERIFLGDNAGLIARSRLE